MVNNSIKLLIIGISAFVVSCSHFSQDRSTGYTLRWLGTAGWKLDYQGSTTLIDPYLSRRSSKDTDGDKLWVLDPDSIEFALKKAEINHVDQIFVSHGHFDHFGDVPYLLKKFPLATVYGNSTVCNILASTNPTAKCIDFSSKSIVGSSGMTVKIIPSLHTFVGPEKKLWYAGSYKSPPHLPLKTGDYLEGGTYMFYFQGEGISFLFQGAANFIEKELIGLHPKTMTIASGLYKNVEDYQRKLIHGLRPNTVLLNHFENFFLPYSSGIVIDKKELDTFLSELHSLDSSLRVTVPQFFKEMSFKD